VIRITFFKDFANKKEKRFYKLKKPYKLFQDLKQGEFIMFFYHHSKNTVKICD